MKNIKKRLIGWTLGLALSLGVGIGIASNTHGEITGVEAAEAITATAKFGKNQIEVNGESVKGKDTAGNEWTITTTGTTSFTNDKNTTYSQIGSSKKPAKTITLTTTLGADYKITGFTSKWGGFGSTAGAISMKVGEIEVATGELNASSDVEVLQSKEAVGSVLTISVTDIAKGVKLHSLAYTYSESKTLSSISIEKEPAKTTYYAGDKFDPTGLVVTKTFDDGFTEALSYAGNGDANFKFNPDLVTPLQETNTSIEITVDGKTASLPITVKPARTITGVTLNGDMDKKSYYEGDAWDVSGLHLTVNWNEGEPTTIQLADLKVKTDYFLDSDIATIGTTSLNITGAYNGFSFEKTIEGLTVTERPSAVKIAYEAAKSLGLSGTTPIAYEFSGVVVGTIGNSFFVQDKDYGMYVYNNAVSGLAVGKMIDIKSTLTTYSGAIETKKVSSATLGEEVAMPTAATISSATDLKALKQNVLVDLEAVMPATLGDWTPGKNGANALNTLTVGADGIVMKFDKFAYNKSSVSGIYSSLAGKKVSIKNAVSSAHDTLEANQLLLTEQTTIEVIKDDYNDALTFGTSFLNETAKACTDGTKDNSEALKTAWTILKAEFNALSDGAKKLVKGTVANDVGTDLEKAMARYDHIVKRYSAAHTEINDFIGRGVTASLTNQLFKANTTNNIMVISLIACASAAAIGSFFFIRKRKEQN